MPHPTPRGDAPPPAGRRPAGTPSNSNLTPAQERAHLVRVIASSPTYVAWLQEHNAKLLTAEASRAAEAGRPDLAAELRDRAAEHRTGTVPAW